MPERPRDRYSFEQPPVRKIAATMLAWPCTTYRMVVGWTDGA